MGFSTTNSRFATDPNKGHPHFPGQPVGPNNPRGSAFPGPVCDPDKNGDYGTWLEYITDNEQKPEGEQVFWFVMYDKAGKVTPMNVSPIFTRKELGTMIQRLVSLMAATQWL